MEVDFNVYALFAVNAPIKQKIYNSISWWTNQQNQQIYKQTNKQTLTCTEDCNYLLSFLSIKLLYYLISLIHQDHKIFQE